MRPVQHARGIIGVLARAIAHRIERVMNMIAEAIGDIGQPVRPIVGVENVARIRQRHQLQEAGRPVRVAGGFGSDLARSQALAQIVGQGRDDAIGVGDRER